MMEVVSGVSVGIPLSCGSWVAAQQKNFIHHVAVKAQRYQLSSESTSIYTMVETIVKIMTRKALKL